jgi:hypothetical protein
MIFIFGFQIDFLGKLPKVNEEHFRHLRKKNLFKLIGFRFGET